MRRLSRSSRERERRPSDATSWPRDRRAPGWHPSAPRRANSTRLLRCRRRNAMRGKCRISNADWATCSSDNRWMCSPVHRASNRAHCRCGCSARYHDSSTPATDSVALYQANPCRCAASKSKEQSLFVATTRTRTRVKDSPACAADAGNRDPCCGCPQTPP